MKYVDTIYVYTHVFRVQINSRKLIFGFDKKVVTDAEEFRRRKRCIYPKLGLDQINGNEAKLMIGLSRDES